MKRKKGITLIALIITIIVLLILSGVAINTIIGNNGILKNAGKTAKKHNNSVLEEKETLGQIGNYINGEVDGSRGMVTLTEEQYNSILTRLDNLEKENKEGNPIGTVISYMGNTAPTGYLFCDGKTYNISDYEDLANQIEREFGRKNYYGGDGTTTFAVPNLKGEFLRGYVPTGETAVTSGVATAAVGKHQAGTVIPHVYSDNTSYLYSYKYADFGSGRAENVDTYRETYAATNLSGVHQELTEKFRSVPSKYTTRPTNTSVLYCIKY